MDVKPGNMEGQLYTYRKNSAYKWTHAIKPLLFKGQLYLYIPDDLRIFCYCKGRDKLVFKSTPFVLFKLSKLSSVKKNYVYVCVYILNVNLI